MPIYTPYYFLTQYVRLVSNLFLTLLLLDQSYNVCYYAVTLDMKSYLLAIFVFAISLLFTSNAFADVVCQPVYGGGQTCVTTGNVQVNKKVQNPQTGQFID